MPEAFHNQNTSATRQGDMISRPRLGLTGATHLLKLEAHDLCRELRQLSAAVMSALMSSMCSIPRDTRNMPG
jgi:hypothetical protein